MRWRVHNRHYQHALWHSVAGADALVALTAAGFAALIPDPSCTCGDYLCIVTIGFGKSVRIAVNNPFGLTGGPNGVLGIDRPVYLALHFTNQATFYLIWVIVILVMFGMPPREFRLGRAWNYVREDELAAEAMGIDATNMKLLAFILGAGLAGIAGTLYAAR